jgi:Flp pilus assembly pilin Flp
MAIRLLEKLRGALQRRGGQTLVEYAAILVLVALVAVVALAAISRSPRHAMDEMASGLGQGTGAGSPVPAITPASPAP